MLNCLDGPRSRKSREFQLKHDGSMVKVCEFYVSDWVNVLYVPFHYKLCKYVEVDLHNVISYDHTSLKFKVSYTIGFLVKKRFYLCAVELQPAKVM